MKKRFLTLLTLMMLAGAMLVGCGGNETGEDNGAGTNTEANVNTEVDVNSGDDTIQIEYGVSNPDATYNETEYCYIVSDAAFVEEKYNDGTEFDRTNWNPVNTMIKLNAPISIYNPFKDIMGYMKTDVTVVYVSVDGEWSYLGFAEEVAKDGLYPNGGTYVRTDELKAVMEEVGAAGNSMSAEVETFFTKFRDRIAEENASRTKFNEEQSEVTIALIEEVYSSDGMECFGEFYCDLNNEEELDNIMTAFISQNYNKYYIEYIGQTSNFVEFNIYAVK